MRYFSGLQVLALFAVFLAVVMILGVYRVPAGGEGTVSVAEPTAPICSEEGVLNLSTDLGSTWLSSFVTQLAATAGHAANRPKGELSIVIDTFRRTLTIYADNRPVKEYPVAVGKPSTPSPVGEWRIASKSYNWGGGFGSRWMGLNVPWGIYGIHGTSKPGSIGNNVSGGCIRMFNRNVEELFSWVSVGTPVTIVGPRPWFRPLEVYKEGMNTPSVVFLQMALRDSGFSPGRADGRFGPATAASVRALEAYYGLKVDGEADENIQMLIGLRP